MAVLFIGEFPGLTRDDDDQRVPMLKRLRQQPGLVLHVEGPTEEGWRVVSVWDSRADFQCFYDATIRPNLPSGAPVRGVIADLRVVVLPERHAPV